MHPSHALSLQAELNKHQQPRSMQRALGVVPASEESKKGGLIVGWVELWRKGGRKVGRVRAEQSLAEEGVI